MSDFFISYSRDDSNFAQTLHTRIEASSKDVWLDCFDIPKGEKFWSEITQGIDAADAFVFILSPSSVEKAAMQGDSAYCRREIEYAAHLNKRIIPIVHQEGFNLSHDIPAHKVLGERNWIFFTAPHQFESSLQELVRALETDQSYVRKHTELTVAAEAWEQRGRRDVSTLISGSRLIEAERWLQQGKAKAFEQSYQKYPSPLPTSLQIAYISASRKYAEFQRRVTIIWLIVPLMLFIPGEYFWREEAVKQDYNRIKQSTDKLEKRAAVLGLAGGCWADRQNAATTLQLKRKRNLQAPNYLRERIFGNCRLLSNAKLEKSDLSGANLSNADFSDANLSGSALQQTNLSGAELGGINLSGARLDNADLSDAMLDDGANLSSAYLGGANLSGAYLSGVNLSGAYLGGVNLSGFKLNYSNLSSTKFRFTNLSSTELNFVNLSNAELGATNLSNAELGATNLSGAKLFGTNLRNVKFKCLESGRELICPNLKDVEWNSQTNWRGIQGWETVKNIPPELKKQLSLP